MYSTSNTTHEEKIIKIASRVCRWVNNFHLEGLFFLIYQKKKEKNYTLSLKKRDTWKGHFVFTCQRKVTWVWPLLHVMSFWLFHPLIVSMCCYVYLMFFKWNSNPFLFNLFNYVNKNRLRWVDSCSISSLL